MAVDDASLVFHVTAHAWRRIFAATSAVRERDIGGESEN
jgi:hypothetical protein